MKQLLFITVILLGFFNVQAQKPEINSTDSDSLPCDYYKLEKYEKSLSDSFDKTKVETPENLENVRNTAFSGTAFDRRKLPFSIVKDVNELPVKEADKRNLETDKTDADASSAQNYSSSVNGGDKFHWKPALIQSGIFLGIQHGFRMLQPKTTRELGGPFFRDWGNSVKNLRGWRDGDNFFTNYIAHPLQGGLTGRIFVNNSDRTKNQEFGKSKDYWNSRIKAGVWSAVWSAQFELGAVSEASIGNVGLRTKNGYSTMASVDLVITPIVGTVTLVGEDAIDKYILKNWLERNNGGKTKIKLLRSVLTPTTSFANLLRGKAPWKRDNRPL